MADPTPPVTPPEAQPSWLESKVMNLWDSNKLLFLIAIPLILIFVLRDLIISALIGSARKTTEAAKAQDATLQAQADATKLEAAKTEQEAKDLDKKIQDRKADDVSEDWNK